jgi:hypothetical protein
MMKVWNDAMKLLKTPFVGSLDLVHLFFLVGVVLVSITLWAIIMAHVTRGISALASEV